MPWIVYLLHFDRPLGKARHYIGITRADQYERRMRDHARGRASRLTRAVTEAGISIYVAHLWNTDDPNLERRLKRQHRAQHWCSYCHLALTPQPNAAINPGPKPAKGGISGMVIDLARGLKPPHP